MDNVVNIFWIILFLVCWFFIIKKYIWNKNAPVKTEVAEIVDIYKSNIVSKYPGVNKQESYVVVFRTKDKKLSFNVSSFSAGNYKTKQKGKLKYKGQKIISFK